MFLICHFSARIFQLSLLSFHDCCHFLTPLFVNKTSSKSVLHETAILVNLHGNLDRSGFDSEILLLHFANLQWKVFSAVHRLRQVMIAPAPARFCSSRSEKSLGLSTDWAGSTRMLLINPELRRCPQKLKVSFSPVNIITTAFSFAAKLGHSILPLQHHCTHRRLSDTKSNLWDHKRAGLKEETVYKSGFIRTKSCLPGEDDFKKHCRMRECAAEAVSFVAWAVLCVLWW